MSAVSIKDVARIAGVSIATVSRCLNEPDRVRDKTRAKVLAAIGLTGYSPNTLAQSFRRGKTNLVMVVLPSVGDPFFTDVMAGIRTVAETSGYSILINDTQLNTLTADEIGAMLVSRQVDGIILLAAMSPFGTEVLSSGSRKALPFVIGCETVSPEFSGFPSVQIDNVAAAAEATTLLIEAGHRRIGFINGSGQALLTADRERGYRRALEDAGLGVREERIAEGHMTIEGAAAAARRLLEQNEAPTAIFCANDEMAFGCCHAIRSMGMDVPRNVSVVGFDDMRYAAVMNPPLTTVRQPAKRIGQSVMQRLIREIDGAGSAQGTKEIVPHELVVRGSVAGPPNDSN